MTSGEKGASYSWYIPACSSRPVESTFSNSCYVKRLGQAAITGWRERDKAMMLLATVTVSSTSAAQTDWNIHSSAEGSQRIDKQEQATGGPTLHGQARTCSGAPASNAIRVGAAPVSLIISRRGANEWHYDPLGGSLGDRGGSCRRDASSCQLSLTSTDTRPPFFPNQTAGGA